MRLDINSPYFQKQLSRTGGDWVQFTPSISSTVTAPTMGDSSINGFYTIIVGVCHMTFSLTLGPTFTAGAGIYLFKPPVNPADFKLPYTVGHGSFYDTSAGTTTLLVANRIPEVATVGGYFNILVSGAANLGAASFPWSANDMLQLQFTFPVW